jgi:hypothetical protein
MQDLNKVNQMFNQMFLGSDMGSKQTGSGKSNDASKAKIVADNLGGAMAAKDRAKACNKQSHANQ